MLSKLLTLDEFMARKLVRPFHLVASAFALLLTASGLMVGIAAMMQSFVVGLFLILSSASLVAALFLGARLLAETVIAVSRMHERFIGGKPGDPVPPS